MFKCACECVLVGCFLRFQVPVLENLCRLLGSLMLFLFLCVCLTVKVEFVCVCLCMFVCVRVCV